ncbi:MAG: hypothetical protein ABSF35_20910 [Polyangia bacterium]
MLHVPFAIEQQVEGPKARIDDRPRGGELLPAEPVAPLKSLTVGAEVIASDVGVHARR